MNTDDDTAAVQNLVEAFVDGWNAGDGAKCARPFAIDADFTTIYGHKAHGRDAIGRGHDDILTHIYKGTHLEATLESIRFVRPDVALGDVMLTMKGANGDAADPGRSLANFTAVKNDRAWSIAVFHNMIPFERPSATQAR